MELNHKAEEYRRIEKVDPYRIIEKVDPTKKSPQVYSAMAAQEDAIEINWIRLMMTKGMKK